MQKIEKLLENENFLNNQNYVLSVKNKYSLYKDKGEIKDVKIMILSTIIIISIFIIFKYLYLIGILFKLVNINGYIFFFSFIIIYYLLVFSFGNIIFKFLYKGKKYLFLKKDPRLENLSYFDYMDKNLNNFYILELSKVNNIFEFIKFNVVRIIITALKSIFLSLGFFTFLLLLYIFTFLQIYGDILFWSIVKGLYLISFVLTFIYLFLKRNSIEKYRQYINRNVNIKNNSDIIISEEKEIIIMFLLLFIFLMLIGFIVVNRYSNYFN